MHSRNCIQHSIPHVQISNQVLVYKNYLVLHAQLNALSQLYSALYSTHLNFKLSSGVQELPGAACAAKCTLAIVFRTLLNTSKFQSKFWCTRTTWCCSRSKMHSRNCIQPSIPHV